MIVGSLQRPELEPMTNVVHKTETRKINKHNRQMLKLVRDFGSIVSGCRSLRGNNVSRTVSEIHSPLRMGVVAKVLPSVEFIHGVCLDLTACDEPGKPCDFIVAERRRSAERLLDEQTPILLAGCSVCTMCPFWQHINNLNRESGNIQHMLPSALWHLQFLCDIFGKQVKAVGTSLMNILRARAHGTKHVLLMYSACRSYRE